MQQASAVHPVQAYDGGLYHMRGICKQCHNAFDHVVEPNNNNSMALLGAEIKHSACSSCVKSFYDQGNVQRSRREFKLHRQCRKCDGFFALSFPITGVCRAVALTCCCVCLYQLNIVCRAALPALPQTTRTSGPI